jgi:hypothetical protein
LPWQNDDLILFHGCTDQSLHSQSSGGIKFGGHPHGHGIDHTRGVTRGDFGPGFYTTTWLHQAKNWADIKAQKVRRNHPRAVALVLRLTINRNDLASLDDLVFTSDGADFFPFVKYCRENGRPHALAVFRQIPYDVIYGPVALTNQTLTIKDSDQVSFHSHRATRLIGSVTEEARGSPFLLRT